MLSFLQKKLASCSLDFGANAVKMVQVRPGKNPALAKVGMLFWTPQEREDRKQAGGKIHELLESHEIKDKVFVSSLHGHSVIIKHVSFSVDSAKKLSEVVQKESKQYIPFDINDVYLDYDILSKKGKNEYDIILVASKKTAVESLERLVAEAGIALSVVDVDAFALCNCYEYNYPENINVPVFLLDIGSSQSVFCVYENGFPVLVRDVPTGGNKITETIARHLNVKTEEAEQIKINGPLDLDVEERQMTSLQNEINEILGAWISELKRVMSYYHSEDGDAEEISTMFLSGGGSLLVGLPELLSEELDLEVRYLDPWRSLRVDEAVFDRNYLRRFGPQFAVATGLALRSVIR